MEITTRRLKVPSPHFPSADLRVEKHTQYEFSCVSCDKKLFAPLSWIVQGDIRNTEIDADVLAAIDRHFSCSSVKTSHSQRHNVVQCENCANIYIIYVCVKETSSGAYRAAISSAIHVLKR